MIAWSDVVLIAPELGTPAYTAKLPDATCEQIVVDVVGLLEETQWGKAYDLACKYLAAHIAALAYRGASGASGAVTQESVGDVSRSYAANSPMGTDPDYDLTPYGRRYKMLKRSLVGRIGIVC